LKMDAAPKQFHWDFGINSSNNVDLISFVVVPVR